MAIIAAFIAQQETCKDTILVDRTCGRFGRGVWRKCSIDLWQRARQWHGQIAQLADADAQNGCFAGQGLSCRSRRFRSVGNSLIASRNGQDAEWRSARFCEDDDRASHRFHQKAEKRSSIGQAGSIASPLNSDQQRMLDEIKAAPADRVDAVYLAHQKMAHQQALMVHQSYAEGGDTPALKTAAAAIVPVVEQHLATLMKKPYAAR